jgi:phosphonate transport system ATP-binding protein
VAQSERTGATFVASLHAVDLALKWFPRVVGMRRGAVAFDLPARAVTPALLHELYAVEGPSLPTQGAELPWQDESAQVVPLPRPGCR